MRNDNYIIIEGWMVNELDLKGNELLIYAIIYGFSQAEGHTYHGTNGYLAEWIHASKQTVITTLKSLVEKGIITKTESVVNGVKFVEYQSNYLTGGCQKTLPDGGQKSLPNNISKRIKVNLYKQIEAYTENEELRETLIAFSEMRDLIKKKLTSRSLTMLLRRLDGLAKTDNEKIAILNQSILYDWQNVYELKDDGYRPRSQTAGVHFSGEREEQTEAFFDPAEDIV